MEDLVPRLWARTTDRSRKVLLAAKAAADSGGFTDIQAEHLIHALYFQRAGVAANVLKYVGWTPSQPALAYYRFGSVSTAAINSSLFLEGVLAEAMAGATQLKHYYVGTEHILMALVKLYPEAVPDPQAVHHEIQMVFGKAPVD